ncbi:hypothetical protein Rhe02_58190 [Rhizocola hellebori]|uniref:DUF6973 domain-containing protein n=1 Tax=Rhizocola hellebori TaxID=1392758 RepID=A0A8J3VIU1_9ACTN|nr:hypothetical protein [Rhizocola hellebori]GIH07752.1 hypothetical protein Rhe02_58190 [Rhizocola hellebori]
MTVAQRQEVKFIEQSVPAAVRVSAADHTRVERLVNSILPALRSLGGRVHWTGPTRERYDERMRQTIEVCEAIERSFHTSAQALNDYATALERAKTQLTPGIAAEGRLGNLLQSIGKGNFDPIRQWQDLRSTDGFWDWLVEYFDSDKTDRIRSQADAEMNTAMRAYGDALQTEQNARRALIDALNQARQALPDLLTSAADVQRIIDQTPGLREDVREAASDPFSRRPVGALDYFQVMADPNPGEAFASERSLLGLGGSMTNSEGAILTELSADQLISFYQLRGEAFTVSQQNFPPLMHGHTAGNDDHTDAYRHAYWNARMTQLYGADFTERYATAHETGANNPGPREAMDLHNNQIGRQIAIDHPHASPAELQTLIRQAVDRGDTVVIGPAGDLVYSDQIRPADTVNSDNLGGHLAPLPGRVPVPQPRTPEPEDLD